MKKSQKEVNDAILFFAKKFNKEQAFISMFTFFTGITRIVEIIVYELFLNKFNPEDCTTEERFQYEIIFEYADELQRNGNVKFENYKI